MCVCLFVFMSFDGCPIFVPYLSHNPIHFPPVIPINFPNRDTTGARAANSPAILLPPPAAPCSAPAQTPWPASGCAAAPRNRPVA